MWLLPPLPLLCPPHHTSPPPHPGNHSWMSTPGSGTKATLGWLCCSPPARSHQTLNLLMLWSRFSLKRRNHFHPTLKPGSSLLVFSMPQQYSYYPLEYFWWYWPSSALTLALTLVALTQSANFPKLLLSSVDAQRLAWSGRVSGSSLICQKRVGYVSWGARTLISVIWFWYKVRGARGWDGAFCFGLGKHLMLVTVVEMLDLILYPCARRFTVNEGCGLLGESGRGLASPHHVAHTHTCSLTHEDVVWGLTLRNCGQWSPRGEGRRWSVAETAPDWSEFPLLTDSCYFSSVRLLQSSAHSFRTRAILI